MTATRTASARWTGGFVEGRGRISLDSSGAESMALAPPERAEVHDGQTSPEELLAAAHAACLCMELAFLMTRAGSPPGSIDVQADVTCVPGRITASHLTVRVSVQGLDATRVAELAKEAKQACPVSHALAGVPISMEVLPASD